MTGGTVDEQLLVAEAVRMGRKAHCIGAHIGIAGKDSADLHAANFQRMQEV